LIRFGVDNKIKRTKFENMVNNESKARMYGELLNEHTRVGNLISEIKAENFEMNDEQKNRIRVLENKQIQIMMAIKKLMS